MGLSQKVGAAWKLPARLTTRELVTSFSVIPVRPARVRSTSDAELRIVRGLLQPDIGRARHGCERLRNSCGGIALAFALVGPRDLHIDRRRRAEVQDLADDIGRQEGEVGTRERSAASTVRNAFT